MAERIVVEAGSPEYEAIRAVLERGADLAMDLEPSRSVARFEAGDRVTVPFDDHWGPAVVESADDQYVRIRYGPRGRPNDLKFRTSIERASVRTDNRQVIPAVVRVL